MDGYFHLHYFEIIARVCSMLGMTDTELLFGEMLICLCVSVW